MAAAHQATLFHHGVPASTVPRRLLGAEGRAFLTQLPLPEAARERIQVALALVDAIDCQLAPLERELRALARRQTGCRALMRHFGSGELTSLTILCELGDVSRLSASRKAVRCKTSPDHPAYLALRERGLSHTRASLTIARKLARRSFHTLHQLGPEALAPVSD